MAKELSEQRQGGKVTKFNPKQTKMKLGALDEGIKLAATIQDWEAFCIAVDLKLDEERNFVGWWTANVTPARGKGLNPSVVAKLGQLETISAAEATKKTKISKSQVSRWRMRLAKEGAYREAIRLTVWATSGNQRTKGTGQNEWYTPPDYIELARLVLGEIDLDPASSKSAQAVVKATKYFTEKENGLEQEWHGRVWLNPPYAQPYIALFVNKLLVEVRAKRTTAAIMLTHNNTDTAWFQNSADGLDAICFTRGRVGFVSPAGDVAAPTNGQAFHYFGDDREKFISVFSDTGFIMVRP